MRIRPRLGRVPPMDWELFYSSFRKPDFIPGYEIQNRLGGGAFGDVYKARKVSIDKPYAIKFLSSFNEVIFCAFLAYPRTSRITMARSRMADSPSPA